MVFGNENENDYDDSKYQHIAVDSITNFHTAATLLRLARSELRVDLLNNDNTHENGDEDQAGGGETIVADFYSLLSRVEEFINDQNAGTRTKKNTRDANSKFLIEIEGLDGSGKTTLVQSLTSALSNLNLNLNLNTNTDNPNENENNKFSTKVKALAVATKTPSKILAPIRPLWDHRGGILARAFYMISNYVLEYEIYNEMSDDVNIVIVDRWFASTIAYSVAYNDNDNDDENENDNANDANVDLEALPAKTFAWPTDLISRPDLLLILNIDHATRQNRVKLRKETGGGASKFNPWDDRLEKDIHLGQRILKALGLVNIGTHPDCDSVKKVFHLNANASQSEVLDEALGIVKGEFEKAMCPENVDRFRENPLLWWRYEGEHLGLCKSDELELSSNRCRHALWNLQIAYSNDPSSPPVLKTMGLDRIDNECIYFWESSSAHGYGSTSTSTSTSIDVDIELASCLWMNGNYPTEQQWRAEGYIAKVTKEECDLRGYGPAPSSLVAHMNACGIAEVEAGKHCVTNNENTNTNASVERMRMRTRMERSEDYDTIVGKVREVAVPNEESVSLMRFVPVRVEVLNGGPSNGYIQRWQWLRDDDGNWVMRSILPFTTATISKSISMSTSMTCGNFKKRGITLAITGCHASGKTTIGKALAKILNWKFDPELGEVLREEDSLQPGGHMHGDGSGVHVPDENNNVNNEDAKDNWDDLILEKEIQRDLQASQMGYCRVVETWHVGNAKWYSLRRSQGNDVGNSTVDIERYKAATSAHEEMSVVLLVNLNISSSGVMLDRRSRDEAPRTRLPLKDEEKECSEMFQALQSKDIASSFDTIVSASIEIDNGDYGPAAMNRTIKSILSFMQMHYHKRLQV